MNLFAILACVLCTCQSAKILGIFHMAAYSHFQLGYVLFKELAARGHDVTLISPYHKEPVKNFKEVLLTGFEEEFEILKKNIFEQMSQWSIFSKIFAMNEMGTVFSEKTITHPNVQKLLKSGEKFDIVIMEKFMNEAFYGFCHYYKAHCVILSTVGANHWTNLQMGNPAPPSYVPEMMLNYPSQMNFWQRIVNSFVYVMGEASSHCLSYPSHNKLMHKHFSDAPHLYDIHYNISLMLLNSHESTSAPVPKVPNMIDIGGFHVQPTGKLPKDIKDYLDQAKEGVVYFSMGSNFKSAYIPIEKREAIIKTLSKLNLKVLWKWEEDSLPGQPKNVKTCKWVPQQDVLAHPNVKLFISHGGLLSTIETIYHGIPIVGIPIAADQEMNIKNAEHNGFAVGVSYSSLTEERLSAAIQKVLNDPKYRENAQTRSTIMHDQPTKPLDRAVFWVEYVLRHDGAPHLRTAALNLTWYQYLLLDVIAFISFVLLTVFIVVRAVIRKLCCRSKAAKVSTTKKSN